MDSKLERSNREKVLRRVAKLLSPIGYRRTKPTFYTRVALPVIEFVHLHKYTFGPTFRAHLGIRVVNDPFEAIALNGPTSSELVRSAKRYDFSYHIGEETVDRCALTIRDFVAEAGEAWFEAHRDLTALASSPASPLAADAREALLEVLSGSAENACIAKTRALLNAP